MDERTCAYLARIGYEGEAAATLDVLAAVLQRHIYSVPYENLDILAGKLLQFDEDTLFDKIVTRRRGGFCFELNAALGLLLRRLGFDVTDCFARYLAGEQTIPMRRHQVLMVRLCGEKWLCDVGVGNEAPRAPLRLVTDEIQNDGVTDYRFERDEYLGWVLCQRHADGFRRQYAFTEEAQIPADFAATSFYCERHPASIFNKAAMIAIKTPGGRTTLDGRTLKFFRPAGVEVRELETDEDVTAALSAHFGLTMKGE